MENIPFTCVELSPVHVSDDVGLSTLPDQIRTRSISKGFGLNIMIIGRRGLGTYTLVNSIFAAPLIERSRTNELAVFFNEIFEGNIRLGVSVATYHGKDSSVPVSYVNEMNMEYLKHENEVISNAPDGRVHVCLYLVPHDEIDQSEVNMIKSVSKICNFVPIITKADSFTKDELSAFKEKVKRIMEDHDVSVYIPGSDEVFISVNDETSKKATQMSSRFPMAIIGCSEVYELDGKLLRGRKYPWGFIESEDTAVSDLVYLRRLIIQDFLNDIIRITNLRFYAAFKAGINEEEKRIHDFHDKKEIAK